MDIYNLLFEGEKIIYEILPTAKKGGNQNKVLSIVVLSFIIVLGFIIYGIVKYDKLSIIEVIMTILPVLLIFLLFIGFLGYALIYNLFIKQKKVMKQKYYLTNYRAIVIKENDYKAGFLENFSEFRVDHKKNEVGDLYMGVVLQVGETKKETLDVAKNIGSYVFKPDKDDMKHINFEQIYNPDEVLIKAREISDELKSSNY